jgi:hypothetical protein
LELVELTPFRGHLILLGEDKEYTMPKTRPPYPPGFRRQMVELGRAGRTPEELSRELALPSLPLRRLFE